MKEHCEKGGHFLGKIQSGRRKSIFGTVVAVTQHARHAKSQSATSFRSAAMLKYTAIEPYNASLIFHIDVGKKLHFLAG